MTLALHLAAHDLRQFRLPIVAWVLLTCVGSAYEAQYPSLVPENPAREMVYLAATAVFLARMLLAVCLIALIVQAHGLVGTSAFWTTRPIAPAVLLRSRLLLFGVLFVVLPAFCDGVLMAFHDVPAVDASLVIAEWSLVRFVGVLLVMVGATMTPTFARFALLAGVGITVVALTVSAFMMLALRTSTAVGVAVVPSFPSVALSARWPDQTAAVAGWLTAVAGMVVVIRSRYRRRSFRHAIAVALGTGVAASVVASAWPWPLLHAAPGIPAWAADDRVRLAAPNGQAVFFDNGGLTASRRPRWRTAHGRIYLSGIPDGWFGLLRLERGTLDASDRRVTSGSLPYSVGVASSPEGDDTRILALEQALAVRAIHGSSRRGTSGAAPLLWLPSTDTPVGGTTATYEGVFAIDLRQVEVAAVLPVQPGARFQDGAYRLTVKNVRLSEGGPRLDVEWSGATSVFHRHPDPEFSVFLRNTVLQEALAGDIQSLTPGTPGAGLILLGRLGYIGALFGFRADGGVIRFPSAGLARASSAKTSVGRAESDDGAWLRNAELVVIRILAHGVIQRAVRIENVALNGGTGR